MHPRRAAPVALRFIRATQLHSGYELFPHAPQHRLVQAAGEGGGIIVIGNPRRRGSGPVRAAAATDPSPVFVTRERGDQRMAQVDLEDRLRHRAAVLLREEALQHAVARSPPATRHEALEVSRCEARTSATRSPSASLIGRDRRGLIRFGARPSRPPCRRQPDQAEIDIALAQRLQRLAAEIDRRRGPERVHGIGQQQHLDAACFRRLQLRVGLQPLDAVADEIIDLGLVRPEVVNILPQRAVLARRRREARQAPAVSRGARNPPTGLP